MRVLVKSIDQHNSKNIEKAGCSVCVWMYMCCTEGKGQSRASCNGVCVCVRARLPTVLLGVEPLTWNRDTPSVS